MTDLEVLRAIVIYGGSNSCRPALGELRKTKHTRAALREIYEIALSEEHEEYPEGVEDEMRRLVEGGDDLDDEDVDDQTHVVFRCTAEEKRRLREAASCAGQNLHDFVLGKCLGNLDFHE